MKEECAFLAGLFRDLLERIDRLGPLPAADREPSDGQVPAREQSSRGAHNGLRAEAELAWPASVRESGEIGSQSTRFEVLLRSVGLDPWAYVLLRLPSAMGPRLSPREVSVANLASIGHSNSQIAWKLEIRECTVAAVLRSIYSKLGISSRAELTSHALLRDLLEAIPCIDGRACLGGAGDAEEPGQGATAEPEDGSSTRRVRSRVRR